MILQLSVKNQSIESSGITNDYKEAICLKKQMMQ